MKRYQVIHLGEKSHEIVDTWRQDSDVPGSFRVLARFANKSVAIWYCYSLNRYGE